MVENKFQGLKMSVVTPTTHSDSPRSYVLRAEVTSIKPILL